MVLEIEFLLLPILQILVRCMHLNQNNTSTSPFQALKNRLLKSIQLCRYGAGGASPILSGEEPANQVRGALGVFIFGSCWKS